MGQKAGGSMTPRRLVVAITGSSGVILGIRLLQLLRETDIETHLVISPAAELTISQETRWQIDDVRKLADFHYGFDEIGSAVASGSFATIGMVIVPCSIKTLSGVANSYADDLITRAADVTLKEGRPLLLAVRETPLHRGHIRLMDLAASAGAIIFPPLPAFYSKPASIDAMVNQLAGRILARVGIDLSGSVVWNGTAESDSEGWPPADLLALPVMSLSIVGKDGRPHLASLYFVSDNASNLYFYSDPASRHTADAADSQAAVTIHPIVEGWEEIRGLQMEGELCPVRDDAERAKAWELYSRKFPFTAGLKDLVDQNALYVFTPRWTRLVDNLRGFGFKEERSV
ncbi:MAG: UbiX family flavin prenyltransferase [Anaerolineaceae bacterium]